MGQRPGLSLLTSPVDKATPVQLQKEVPGSLCVCRVSFGQAGIVVWSKTMIEKQRVPGSRTSELLGSGRIFPAMLRPTVNWELVAFHEGNMDAVNGIFGL